MAASLKALPCSRPMENTADPLIAYLEEPNRERIATLTRSPS